MTDIQEALDNSKEIEMSKQRKSNKKTRIIILSIILIIVAALICGIVVKMISDKKVASKENIKPADNIGIHVSEPKAEEDSEDLSVDILYGVIHFPNEFSDYTHVEIEDNDEQYRVVFCCKYEDNNIPLFAVTFGEPEEGAEIVGQLIDTQNVAKNVSINVYELSLDTEWAENNAELLYSMQEAVNYVVEEFESTYEFQLKK